MYLVESKTENESTPATVIADPGPKPPRTKVNFANIPDILKKQARWVTWKWELNDKGTKWTKVPYQANPPRYGTPKASSTDPETWATYEQAKAAYEFPLDQVDGIGFVLGDGWGGVDVDKCLLPDGSLIDDEDAKTIVDNLYTYAEISPSDTGIKGIGFGTLVKGRKHGNLEIYSSGGFFTLTGNSCDGDGQRSEPEPVRDIQPLFEAILEYYMPPEKSLTTSGEFVPIDLTDFEQDERFTLAHWWVWQLKPCRAKSGRSGPDGYFYFVACSLRYGFGLDDDVSRALLRNWGGMAKHVAEDGVTPWTWTIKESDRKFDSAKLSDGQVPGWMLEEVREAYREAKRKDEYFQGLFAEEPEPTPEPTPEPAADQVPAELPPPAEAVALSLPAPEVVYSTPVTAEKAKKKAKRLGQNLLGKLFPN